MRLAYIISAYTLPAMLVRLVRRLDAPGTSIFIHVDARTRESAYRAMVDPLADHIDVHFLPRHPCHWGDFGHVRATLKGLAALLTSRHDFDYVGLLTGQDYPLRSNGEIAEFLDAASGGIFMVATPLPNPHWTDGGISRFEHWHVRVAGRTIGFPGSPFRKGPLDAAWLRITGALGLRRAFPPGLRAYGGPSYWLMPADCARFVHDWAESNPRAVRFFHHVHVPDELFFQSVVMSSAFRDRLAGDDLRFVDWQQEGDSPKVLTTDDFDRLMRSDKLFARKFDPTVDRDILDRIDRTIGDRVGRAGRGAAP